MHGLPTISEAYRYSHVEVEILILIVRIILLVVIVVFVVVLIFIVVEGTICVSTRRRRRPVEMLEQDVVGLAKTLKLGSGVRVVWILVRMCLQGQLEPSLAISNQA